MSWPSTDFEVEVQQELEALRRVYEAARRVIAGRIPAVSSPEWKHSRISDTLIDKLAEALANVPEEST